MIKSLLIDLVNLFENLERLDYWQIPPQLCPLPKHDAHDLCLADAVVVWGSSIDFNNPAGGLENTGHHFDRGGCPCIVRADRADDLTMIDVLRDACDRVNCAITPRE